MNQESEKYKKVIELLKVSKPKLESSVEIENEVINRIANARPFLSILTRMVDFLFSWVYIGWVRRSLITASVAMVVIFIFQQGVILKRIDFLSRQTVVIGKENLTEPSNKFEKILMNYKNGLRKLPSRSITISEKQMNELIESVNELQLKYKDLEKLIEDDPEIKKLIEKKIIENSRNKI
jgi:hypothetical protein